MGAQLVAKIVLKTMKNRMSAYEYKLMKSKINSFTYSEWSESATEIMKNLRDKFTKMDMVNIGLHTINADGTQMPREEIFRWIKDLSDSSMNTNLIDVVDTAQTSILTSKSVADIGNIFESFEAFTNNVDPAIIADGDWCDILSDNLKDFFEQIGDKISDIDLDKVGDLCCQGIKMVFGGM